jgi:uncharacterized protein YeaO (DUF488 family)
MKSMIKIRRVYERAEVTDGTRLLVDRLWPRGIRRNTPNVDIWLKDIGPSNELRKWFSHDPVKWMSFKSKYIKELEDNTRAVANLLQIVRSTDTVTLVYATKDTDHNNALVLREFLKRKFKIE